MVQINLSNCEKIGVILRAALTIISYFKLFKLKNSS